MKIHNYIGVSFVPIVFTYTVDVNAYSGARIKTKI